YPAAPRDRAPEEARLDALVDRHQLREGESAGARTVQAEDGAAGGVEREHPPLLVEHRHAVVHMAEELLVAPHLRQLALGRHALRPLALDAPRAAQRDGYRAGHAGQEGDLALRESDARPRAHEEDA